MVKICDICGKEFETKTVAKTCDACRMQPCIICGKPVKLNAHDLNRFKERGFTCCSRECGEKQRQKSSLEKNGYALAFQDPEIRARAHEAARTPESLERRSQSMRRTLAEHPEIQEQRQEALMESYGVKYPLQSEVIKARYRKTYRENNDGRAETPFSDPILGPKIRELGKQKMVENHGVEHGLQSKEIHAKTVESTEAHWGKGGYFASKEGKERAREIFMERYGVTNPAWLPQTVEGTKMYNHMQTEKHLNDIVDYIDNHDDPTVQEISLAVGLGEGAVRKYIHEFGLDVTIGRSPHEKQISDLLDELGVSYIRNIRTVLDGQELDFYIEDKKLAIEVNDFWTHSYTHEGMNGIKPKPEDYHEQKTLMCREKGIKLIHAWEHCLPNSNIESHCIGSWNVLRSDIKRSLGLCDVVVDAKDTEFFECELDDAIGFFDSNGIGEPCDSWVFSLVRKDTENPTADDILIAYTFNGGLITSIAYAPDTFVEGGDEKLVDYILEKTKYDSLMFWIDSDYIDRRDIPILGDTEVISRMSREYNYWKDEGFVQSEMVVDEHLAMYYAHRDLNWKIKTSGLDVYVWHRQA